MLGGFSFALNNVMLRREAHRPEAARALAMFLGGALVALVLATSLSAQGLVALPLGPIVRQQQQTRANHQGQPADLKLLLPLTPELERSLPQPPGTASTTMKHIGHQEAKGSPAATEPLLRRRGSGQIRIDQGDAMATLHKQPGGGHADDAGPDHDHGSGPLRLVQRCHGRGRRRSQRRVDTRQG